jgi:hypothetical protein
MKRILLLLQLAFTTIAFGAGSSVSYPSVSTTNTVQVASPSVLTPPTSNYLSSPGTVQAQIVPGGLYSICASVSTAVLGATANILTSCTTTLNSKTVNYAGTLPAIGQILGANAYLPVGAYVTGTGAGTFTSSLAAIQAGVSTMNITAGSFVAPVQVSPDGTTWTTVSNLIPKTYLTAATLTGTIVTPGLYMYQAGPNDKYIRVNLTSISSAGVIAPLTSYTLRFNIDSWDRPGAKINLPYFNYSSASGVMPQYYSPIPPIDLTGLCEMQVDCNSTYNITTRAFTSNDDSGQSTGNAVNFFNTTGGTGIATAFGSPGSYKTLATSGYLYFTLQYASAATLSFSGVTARVGFTTTQAAPLNVNLGTIGAGSLTLATIGLQAQSTYNGSYVCLGIPVPLLEVNAASVAGTQRYSPTASVYVDGGLSVSADILITITTLGSASAIIPIFQQSSDNATWTDIWKGVPQTITGHQQMPAILTEGMHRFCFEAVGGNATTATATVNSKELPGVYPAEHQYFDIYAATNPTSTVINGVNTASTLVSTSSNSVTSPFVIDKCKTISAGGVFTGGTPSTAPIYTLQVSNDLVNWKNTTCTFTPTAAGYFSSDIQLTGAYHYARLIVSTASSGGTPYGVTYTAINALQ